MKVIPPSPSPLGEGRAVWDVLPLAGVFPPAGRIKPFRPGRPLRADEAEKTKTGFSPPPGLRPGDGMNRLTLESLILAQDERWRRA